MKDRLHKIIAQAGIASRRKAEELIKEGRITINGVAVTELGTKADPRVSRIEIDGKRLPPQENKLYLMLNKPHGYVTTLHDPEGRPTVIELISAISERLYPVGRLDYASEGLLLLTNDGDFAHLLQHPRHNIARTYLVKVKGYPAEAVLARLQKGIVLDGVKTGRTRIKMLRRLEKNTWLEVTLWEGRNRQIKKMFSAIRHPAMRILRIQFGPLQLDKTPPGSYRSLTKQEILMLKNFATSSAK